MKTVKIIVLVVIVAAIIGLIVAFTKRGGEQDMETLPTTPNTADIGVHFTYFGVDKKADVNADGKEDVVYWVTEEGRTDDKIVYYAAVALGTGNNEYAQPITFMIGDRIAPQTTQIKGGVITMRYVGREANEPVTAEPTVSMTKDLKVIDGMLVEAK